MLTRLASVLILLTATAIRPTERATSSPLGADPGTLVVHEWGTFTTVAGVDGLAIDWLPLGGPTDLPCFVEHFQNRRDVKVAPNQPPLLDYVTARSNLWGRVRMETPVLYFYPRRAMALDVRVRFPHGLMTEWYPHATVTQPLIDRNALTDAKQASIIAWPNVIVSPGAPAHFPAGTAESHYYAARNTDAAPLRVGGQSERFLFYRGVSSFDVPLAAEALSDGRIRIRNLARDEIPGVVLFESHNGRIGYRVIGALHGDLTLTRPSASATLGALRSEIERMLVRAGLYPKEAAAMVDSWRDSWFEEGTRVFYILPSRTVDSVLPLTVAPAPDSVARVFVGRMEVITPDIERTVENAIATGDPAVLERFGRFLGPITDRILATRTGAAERQRIGVTTQAAFASYLRRASICE